MAQIVATMPDWVFEATLKGKKNKSQAVVEALLKTFWRPENRNGVYGLLSRYKPFAWAACA